MSTLKDKYINPFTDFGFKKLFGTEFNKPLLVDFLNEVLSAETGKIKELQYLSTEKLPSCETDRKAIFDIYCENEQGEKFIVELQKAKTEAYTIPPSRSRSRHKKEIGIFSLKQFIP